MSWVVGVARAASGTRLRVGPRRGAFLISLLLCYEAEQLSTKIGVGLTICLNNVPKMADSIFLDLKKNYGPAFHTRHRCRRAEAEPGVSPLFLHRAPDGASADGNVARIAHRQCDHAPTVLFS